MIPQALHILRPGAQWTLNGENYAGLVWQDKTQSKPTEAEVRAAIEQALAERDAAAYRDLRAQAYPTVGDQLDALFHAGLFPPEMAAQIQAVKDRFPKPEQ